jgi:hypothetical protein
MLKDTAVGVTPAVKVAGVKVHVAYMGRLAQLIVTTPVNPPMVPMLKSKFAGLPAGTVAVEAPAGDGRTKSGTTAIPVKLTLCGAVPVELTVTTALSSPFPVGLNEMLMLQVAFTPTAAPQPEFTVKSVEFCPVTAIATVASATLPEFCNVSVCCATLPTDMLPNEMD